MKNALFEQCAVVPPSVGLGSLLEGRGRVIDVRGDANIALRDLIVSNVEEKTFVPPPRKTIRHEKGRFADSGGIFFENGIAVVQRDAGKRPKVLVRSEESRFANERINSTIVLHGNYVRSAMEILDEKTTLVMGSCEPTDEEYLVMSKPELMQHVLRLRILRATPGTVLREKTNRGKHLNFLAEKTSKKALGSEKWYLQKLVDKLLVEG